MVRLLMTNDNEHNSEHDNDHDNNDDGSDDNDRDYAFHMITNHNYYIFIYLYWYAIRHCRFSISCSNKCVLCSTKQFRLLWSLLTRRHRPLPTAVMAQKWRLHTQLLGLCVVCHVLISLCVSETWLKMLPSWDGQGTTTTLNSLPLRPASKMFRRMEGRWSLAIPSGRPVFLFYQLKWWDTVSHQGTTCVEQFENYSDYIETHSVILDSNFYIL